jgi:hypothetical protein
MATREQDEATERLDRGEYPEDTHALARLLLSLPPARMGGLADGGVWYQNLLGVDDEGSPRPAQVCLHLA